MAPNAQAGGSKASYRRGRSLYESHADLSSSLSQYESLAREEAGSGAGGTSGAAAQQVAEYNSQVLRALLASASSGGGELPAYVPPTDGDEPALHSLDNLTALHNAALAAYAQTDVPRALSLLLPALSAASSPGGSIGGAGIGSGDDEAETLAVLIDLSFLAVDCALGLSRGDALGLGPVGTGAGTGAGEGEQMMTVDDILKLVEGCMGRLTKLSGGAGSSAGAGGSGGAGDDVPPSRPRTSSTSARPCTAPASSLPSSPPATIPMPPPPMSTR